MDKYPHIVELIAMWEEQARQALPADAMLLNKQIRQLREALYTFMPAKHVLVPVELAPQIAAVLGEAAPLNTHELGALWANVIAARPEVP